MSRHFSTAEQISVLSDEQIDALLVEMEAGRETQVEPDGVKRLIGKGIIRGAAAFGEGALLGFQGRPLSEGTFTGDKPKAATDTYGELLKREQLKNIVDPSRIKAQQDIEENKRKEEVLQRKLREQRAAPDAEAITPTEQVTRIDQDQSEPVRTEVAVKRPPKRVKIGEDENGLAIFGDNPDYADALKQEAEVRGQEFAIQKEERSIDLIAKKAAEKDRQLNISKISRLTNLVDLIETEYEKTKTPSGISGVLRRPLETFTRGVQFTENQRQDKAYGDFIGGMKVQLARAMSEVGNLSMPEQQAALDLVPDLLTDPRTAEIKLKQLRDLVSKVQGSPNRNDTSTASGEIPSVGETFMGEKVLKIRKKQ